jgi:hypothetical protein
MAAQPKIRQMDLIVPALRYLSKHKNGVETGPLREYLEDIFQPSGVNAKLVGKPGDRMTAFSQIARNAVSNRKKGKNLMAQGLCRYDVATKTSSITDKGRRLLRSIGYVV